MQDNSEQNNEDAIEKRWIKIAELRLEEMKSGRVEGIDEIEAIEKAKAKLQKQSGI